MDIRTNSDYFLTQHKLIGLYNRDGMCLLRGTDWVFKHEITQFEDLDLLLCDALSLRNYLPNFGKVREKKI